METGNAAVDEQRRIDPGDRIPQIELVGRRIEARDLVERAFVGLRDGCVSEGVAAAIKDIDATGACERVHAMSEMPPLSAWIPL